jgi:hypothetical protein
VRGAPRDGRGLQSGACWRRAKEAAEPSFRPCAGQRRLSFSTCSCPPRPRLHAGRPPRAQTSLQCSLTENHTPNNASACV